MIAAIAIQPVSLTDPPPDSAITSAASWVGDLLFGQLATAIAVIAIAWVGFAMLSGRVDIRRGLSVVLGCFLLYGARGIADGLRDSATQPAIASSTDIPPPPVYARTPSAANSTNAFDPYAGAAVLQQRQ
jgi:type IV secretion system protein VirB2